MAKKSQAERAQGYFEHNPNVSELFGTTDGNLFTKIQHCLTHSTTLENKEVSTFTKEGKVETVNTEDNGEDEILPDFLKLSVSKIKEALPQINEVETLIGYLETEQDREDPRTTAIAAIEARVAELES